MVKKLLFLVIVLQFIGFLLDSMFWLSFLFLTFSSAFAVETTQVDFNKATGMLNFAKQSLIESTKQTKEEFGINDDKSKQKASSITLEQKYSSAEFRDIFFKPQESSLIVQAHEYFKQGKKMYIKSQNITEIEELERTIKPILRLSSLMYEGTQQWVVFTNIGKFTYRKPFINDVKIIGISSDEVEFLIPLTNVGELKNSKEYKERISIIGNNVAIKLRTGECIFEKNVKITTKCSPIVEKFTTKSNVENNSKNNKSENSIKPIEI